MPAKTSTDSLYSAAEARWLSMLGSRQASPRSLRRTPCTTSTGTVRRSHGRGLLISAALSRTILVLAWSALLLPGARADPEGDDIDCGCAFDCIANISGGSVSSGCTNASISWGPNTNATDYSNYCVIVWREGKKVDCQSAEIGLEVNFPGLESGVEYRYQITANGGSNCSMEEAFVTKKCGFDTNLVVVLSMCSVLVLVLLILVAVSVSIMLYIWRKRKSTSVALYNTNSPIPLYSGAEQNGDSSRLSTDYTPGFRSNGLAMMSLVKCNEKALNEKALESQQEKLFIRSMDLPSDEFKEHVRMLHEDYNTGFSQEYRSLEEVRKVPCEVATLPYNSRKNRFDTIYPYDSCRVKLQEIPDEEGSDYINASFVDGYRKKDAYIGSQGPLPNTTEDFWRMVWEYRLPSIIMLTKAVEAGKVKCQLYWPEEMDKEMRLDNGLCISLRDNRTFADYCIRKFAIREELSEETEEEEGAAESEQSARHVVQSKELIVQQYHFTSWPDHGVPQFATALLGFLKTVRRAHPPDGPTLLVHCSAGVGRTGTFIALDWILQKIKEKGSVNVYECVKTLRDYRCFMVQTEDQYVFIHDAVLEMITCGQTEIAVSNLLIKMNKLRRLIPGKIVSGYQQQFHLLEEVTFRPNLASCCKGGAKACNVNKNRYPDLLPYDNHRFYLKLVGPSSTDYINASLIDGYRQRNGFVATQGPLESTIADFWKMVCQVKSRAIVMLCNLQERGEEACSQYWPTFVGGTTEYASYKVTLESEQRLGELLVRKLKVVEGKLASVTVTQFHHVGWYQYGCPESTSSVLLLADQLTKSQMSSGNNPITVMCDNGSGRSGAFICLYYQLERLKTEGVVDLFQCVKSIRTQRPGLVDSVEQYVFCHEVLLKYVTDFDAYANFKQMS